MILLAILLVTNRLENPFSLEVMDVIREHLIYKDVPIHICFGKLKPIEQYECIRLLLATRTKDVLICKHNSVNKYIQELLELLKLQEKQC